MHMADALISPAVGAAMYAATGAAAAYSAKKLASEADEKKVPLMGVLGAFVFAAQMINFSIPGTGSSGHLGGGLLLAALLGPHAGFLVMASILIIQALFFADGGLLALGANIFNLGFFTCFLAYPLIYRRIVGQSYSPKRILIASLAAAVIGLQLGAFGVVLETLFSGKTELPFGAFVLLMQPIHLAIGIVEGLVTAAVVSFVWRARPEVLKSAATGSLLGEISLRRVLIGLAAAAAIAGALLSWFASTHPDGLEWSMFRASGKEELEAKGGLHQTMALVQEKTAFLPDYCFKEAKKPMAGATENSEAVAGEAWPAVSVGTSVSGLVGGLLTLLLAASIGFVVRALRLAAEKKP